MGSSLIKKETRDLTYYGFKQGKEDKKECGLKQYYNALMNSKVSEGKLNNIKQDFYQDPDMSYDIESEYYNDLTTFLNEQESIHLNGNWIYNCNNEYPGGIDVIDKSTDKLLFKLRSDQFGFSVPVNGKNHPYGRYLVLSIEDGKKEEACKNIVNWINKTRTIGGSFLWPIRKCADGYFRTEYNQDRGGQVDPPKKSYYIQDRVDLTLLEIKHCYDPNYEKKYSGDKLFRYYIDDEDYDEYECSHMKQWLEHFGTFYNYVCFFKFSDFVNTKTLQIKNIINNGYLEDVKRTPELTNNLSKENWEEILKRVSSWTLNRSVEMVSSTS